MCVCKLNCISHKHTTLFECREHHQATMYSDSGSLDQHKSGYLIKVCGLFLGDWRVGVEDLSMTDTVLCNCWCAGVAGGPHVLFLCLGPNWQHTRRSKHRQQCHRAFRVDRVSECGDECDCGWLLRVWVQDIGEDHSVQTKPAIPLQYFDICLSTVTGLN